MPFYSTPPVFIFESANLPRDTFGVVAFHGREGLSECYDFEIELISQNPSLDLDDVVSAPATLTIRRENADPLVFSGILPEFEQLQTVDEQTFYRARLMPRLWWARYTRQNQVFLNKTAPRMIEDVLGDAGLAGQDYELRLQNPPTDPWELACQYGESHLNFVSRWMEREGMYYFFEQTPEREKLIVTDSSVAHAPMPGEEEMRYVQGSGLEHGVMDRVVHDFRCLRSLTPRSLKTRDYNYRTPSLDIRAEARVSDDGLGEVYLYNEHARTQAEARRLAAIRAQGYTCRQTRFHGRSYAPAVRTGYVFALTNHPRPDFNRRYLTISVEHEGSQVGYLTAGLQAVLTNREQTVSYRNSFEAIPADVQFRPERIAEKPRFAGTLNAHVDASGSGKYAELDDQGRYKIRLPFDLSDRGGGKASAWLRMAQPYGGENMGMHFPLHKGTEVLLTFIEGDPDRPIISAAVPNPETRSPVTEANQSQSVIKTGGNNQIAIEDKDGGERILMKTPNSETFVRMGEPNDPDMGFYNSMNYPMPPPDPAESVPDEAAGDEPQIFIRDRLTGEVRTPTGVVVPTGGELQLMGASASAASTSTSAAADKWSGEGDSDYTPKEHSGYRCGTKGNIYFGAGGSFNMQCGGFRNVYVLGTFSNKFVAGEDLATVLGQKTRIVLGANSGLNIPWKMECNWVKSDKFEGDDCTASAIAKTLLAPFYRTAAAVHDKVSASRNEATGTVVWARGSESGAAGNSNQATGSNNEATGSNNEATGNNNQAVGNNNQATGNNNQATGNNNQATGSNNQATGLNNENNGTNVQNNGTNVENNGLNSAQSGLNAQTAALHNMN